MSGLNPLQSVYFIPLAAAMVAVVSYVYFSQASNKKGMVNPSTSTPIKDHLSLQLKSQEVNSGVLDQFPMKEKLDLQTRVANAVTASDLLQIFVDYKKLGRLRLNTDRITSDESFNQANEQAFKDLVRERILINNVPIEPVQHADKNFRQKFLTRIEDTISAHVADLKMRQLIAPHICCHLSRTRAGGDSYFAIQDIFATPQFTITAAAAASHPPTSLLVTPDGWAVITTTSNFDVYSKTDLSGEDDTQPSALVTISAVVEEAVPLSQQAKEAWVRFIKINSRENSPANNVKGDERHSVALPVSRTLKLTCAEPGRASRLYGSANLAQPVRRASTSPGTLPADPRAMRCGSIDKNSSSARGSLYSSSPNGSGKVSTNSKESTIMQKSLEQLRASGGLKTVNE